MPADTAEPPSLAHAAVPPFSLAAGAMALAPADAVTQLYYLLPAVVVATFLTAWLARGGGWERLGLRTTPYTLRVFGASWFLVAVAVGIVARPIDNPTGTAVSLVGYGLATALGTWLTYRGGAAALRRIVAR